MRGTKRTLWEGWIDRNVDTDDPVPLFATESPANSDPNGDGGDRVELIEYGQRRRRPVLRRSDAMDERLRDAVETVVDDHETRSGEYDGLVYLMYALEGSQVVPYYIGKTGTFRRADAGLSANLASVSAAGGKFARWGYGDAYHIGDLSAAVLAECDGVDTAGHGDPKEKYRRWAKRLFEPGTRPSGGPYTSGSARGTGVRGRTRTRIRTSQSWSTSSWGSHTSCSPRRS